MWQKRGLDLVAIADHNTIKGGLAAKRLEKKYGIRVVVGTEITTDIGDIIGLNLVREIKARKWEEVIAEIRAQNGIVMLPHPFRNHDKVSQVAEIVDLIEVFNSRSDVNENQKAKTLAANLNKISVIGSDSHLWLEIGNTKMLISEDLRETKIFYEPIYAKSIYIYIAQTIGHIRKGKLHKLIGLAVRHIMIKIKNKINNNIYKKMNAYN